MMPVGGVGGRPLFSVLGIPVTVDPWFLLGLLLVAGMAGSTRAGLIAAALLAVFTLLHELGHALTARRAGARSAIRLGFLVAWASYAPTTPLSRSQLVRISLMGPLVQVVVGLVALWALGGPLSTALASGDRARSSLLLDVWFGLTWAGVLIGLLNLLPLWPLDGSHVVARLLTSTRRPQHRVVASLARITIAVCVASVVVGVFVTQTGIGDSARDDWSLRHTPLPGDGPLTILRKELLRLPVRLTEPFVIVFVGLFCVLNSYQVVKATTRRREPPPGRW